MNQLETLLNTLIQMGRKPFGKKYTHLNYDPKRKHRHIMFGWADLAVFSYSLRQLVSLESGLWQFVCINDLYKYSSDELVLNPSWRPDWLSSDWSFFCWNSEYRLLESALTPEEELAKFLIDNIIVKWPGKN